MIKTKQNSQSIREDLVRAAYRLFPPTYSLAAGIGPSKSFCFFSLMCTSNLLVHYMWIKNYFVLLTSL